MRKLIVNADDFGRHVLINDAVIQGHVEGCITSATLMPSAAAFDDAVTKAAAHPSLGVGVHLTLIGEKPLLPPEQIPSLVDENGQLAEKYPQFMARFFKGAVSLKEVRAELAAQIQKVVDSGLRITHIDSHQHLHLLPGIIDIALELAAAHQIKAVRIPSVPLGFTGGYSCTPGQFVGRSGLIFLAALARRKARQRGFRTPDHFFGIVAGGGLREESFLEILRKLPAGSTEIMIHPGTDNQALAAACGWAHQFEEELQTALSSQAKTLLKERQITLASFRDIP